MDDPFPPTPERRRPQDLRRPPLQRQEEAGKLEAGLYTPSLPRDVFLCYSSKDRKDVVRILDLLEDNGFTVFAAFRNLRHGKGAAENYLSALQEAMSHCKCVVFLSSKSSRSVSCDAIKVELPYIQSHLPKMGRVEYLLEPREARLPLLVERLLKETFAGVEWCQDEEDLILRVQSLTDAKPIVCPKCKHENAPGTLFCHQCGEPLNEEARKRKEEEQEELARKVLGQVQPSQPNIVQDGVNIDSLLTRANILMEGGDFEKADRVVDNVLDHDPRCGKAYLYQYMIAAKIRGEGQLSKYPLAHNTSDPRLANAIRFGGAPVKKIIDDANAAINAGIQYKKDDAEYQRICQFESDKQYKKAAEGFDKLGAFRDAKARAENCRAILYKQGEEMFRKKDYARACAYFADAQPYKDSSKRLHESRQAIAEAELQRAIADAKNLAKGDKNFGRAIERLNPYIPRGSKEVAELIEDFKTRRHNAYLRLKEKGDKAVADIKAAKQEYLNRIIPDLKMQALVRPIDQVIADLVEILRDDDDFKEGQALIKEYNQVRSNLEYGNSSLKAMYKKRRKKKTIIVSTSLVTALVAGVLATFLGIMPVVDYKRAETLYAEGKYEEAAAIYAQYAWWGENGAKYKQAKMQQGISALQTGDYKTAIPVFTELGDYEDAKGYLAAAEATKAYKNGEIDARTYAARFKAAGREKSVVTYHYDENNGSEIYDVTYGSSSDYLRAAKSATSGEYLIQWNERSAIADFASWKLDIGYQAEYGTYTCAIPQGFMENGITYAYYGGYPQDKVIDEALIAKLDELAKPKENTGNISDFDIDYEGGRYRRSYYGNFGRTWYWYQWKPILWRVLTPEEAKSEKSAFSFKHSSGQYLLSTTVIDIDSSGVVYSFNDQKNYPRDDYADMEVRQTLRGSSSEEKGIVYDYEALADTFASELNATMNWHSNSQVSTADGYTLASYQDPVAVPTIEIMERLSVSERKATYSEYATQRVIRGNFEDAKDHYWLLDDTSTVYTHYLMDNGSGVYVSKGGKDYYSIVAGVRPIICIDAPITLLGK